MSNITKLCIGDVVYRKGAILGMTVSAIANNRLTAVWFDEHQELHSATLPEDRFELTISN